MSLKKFDRHRCFADVAVVNLKRAPRNFKRASCTTKKCQTQNVESVLRSPKNAKTTLKLLSNEGPGSIYQLCYCISTIRIKRIWPESLTRNWKKIYWWTINSHFSMKIYLLGNFKTSKNGLENRQWKPIHCISLSLFLGHIGITKHA